MLKKIYIELRTIRRELQAIRSSLEQNTKWELPSFVERPKNGKILVTTKKWDDQKV